MIPWRAPAVRGTARLGEPANVLCVAYAPRPEGVSLVGDVLLSLGILLTTASQLRLSDLPVGPGELCLVSWLVLMLALVAGREPGRLGPVLTSALTRLLVFWSVSTISQGLGFLTGLFTGERYDPEWLLHDVMAYPLLAAVSCMSVIEPGARLRLRRVASMLVLFGNIALALQVAVGWKVVETPLFQPWYWERFRGWSANPNQLALLCSVLGLLSLHLVETASRPGRRLLAIACLILPISVGRMTGSDTFTLILMASGSIFVMFKIWTWLRRSGRRITIQSEFAGIVVLGLPLLLISLAPLAFVAAADAGSFAKDLSKNGGKELQQESDLRFALWGEAIELGIKSVFLGLGPGPHLPIPASISAARARTPDQPESLPHPHQSLAPNFEAHNSFLDLLTQGGMIATLRFIWILSSSIVTALKARRAGLATLICGLIIFCMTSLITRHPLFWFAIALCLTADDRSMPFSQSRVDARSRLLLPFEATPTAGE